MQMRNRREALEGLGRILDAGALEDLFAGPDDEAAFLYDLLQEVARGRSSGCYWEICRTARRRNVTPEYVVDRAAILLAAMEERRRTDLYRILGAPPLASQEMLRQCWLDFAKTNHPDVGGDAARFRQVKEAWEILRDPDRRSEYERFWVRALGPFERVTPSDHGEGVGPMLAAPRTTPPAAQQAPERRVVLVVKKAAATAPPPPVQEDGTRGLRHAAARVLAARDVIDRRVRAPGGGGLSALVGQLDAMLAPVAGDEIAGLQAEIADAIARMEALDRDLGRLLALKQALG